VLALKFGKTGDSHYKQKRYKHSQRIALTMKMKCIFFYCSRKGFRRCVQVAKQQAVWLSLVYVNRKYLWALPTPTTFKKVDQTF
jgi:hypothetical protein